MNHYKKGVSGGKITAVGVGVAALGAGAYYLLGPKAKTHQKKAKILLAKMKKEVESELKGVNKIVRKNAKSLKNKRG